jgi:membrane-associated phospholipid phosphatase
MNDFIDAMLAVNLFFQSMGNWLEIPMQVLSFLGSEEFYLLFGPAIYWCFDAAIGLHVALFLNISISLNAAFKFAFQGPRPFWVSSQIIPYAGEGSFGIPSGHSMNSATIFGGMAWLIKKAWAVWGALILVIMIGISRIYLGVHFLHDVLLGWALGLLLIFVIMKAEPAILAWMKKQSFTVQIGSAFGTSLALLAPAVLIHFALNSYQIPAEWTATALQAVPDLELAPLSLESTLSSVGAFFGIAFGALWTEYRCGGYKADGSMRNKILRYLVGVVIIFALWRGLGVLQPDGENWISYTIRYLRYAITGFWITGLAPAVFKRLHVQ